MNDTDRPTVLFLCTQDPAGQDLATVRPIRDDIERRVRALLDQLGVA